MKYYIYVVFLFSLLLTNSCATIVDGSTQAVSFASEPQGVEVSVNGRLFGKTPMTIQMVRENEPIVEFNLEGYKKQTSSLHTETNPWFLGNIITGGLIGSSIDTTSGSIYEYVPDHYYVTMVEGSSNPVNSVTSEKSKIKEFIIVSYMQIINDMAKGEGEYLDSLVSILKIEDSNRSESIQKIKSLSEVYTIIPDFAEQVANYFLK